MSCSEEIYSDAAKRNNLSSMYYLAFCFYYGVGTEVNLQQAFTYFDKSARLGLASAIYNVGICYYQGIGTPVNNLEAIKWFSRISNLGLAKAHYALALTLLKEKRYEESIVYFKKAEAREYKDASYELGVIFYQGEGGIPQNYHKAYHHFLKAANLGDRDSMYYAAEYLVCYSNNPNANPKALSWLKQAAEMEHPGAKFIVAAVQDDPGKLNDAFRITSMAKIFRLFL